MSKVIHVSPRVTRCEEDFDGYFVDVMNGLVYYCYKRAGYSAGERNEIALNLTVGSYMLGLDALEILDEFMQLELICSCDDDEDPRKRVERALEYRFRFDWDYMINPEDYESWATGPWYNKEEMPIVFELD